MKKIGFKKVLSVLLAIATVLSVTAFGFGAYAQTAEPLFTLSDVETRQGEEFDVTVKFAKDISPKGDKIAALDISLTYDSQTFEPVDLVKGDGLNKAFEILSKGTSTGLDKGDYVYSCSKKVPGSINWSMTTLDSFTFNKGEDFMVIHFKAKEQSSLEGNLNMEISVKNATAPDFSSKTDNYGPYTNSVKVDTNLTTLCNWRYDERTNGYELSKYNGKNATYFTVPDVYDDESDERGELPVTIIGTGAFRAADTIERITLGRNIKSVNSAAFMECKSLKKIVFYSTDVNIGANAFALTNDDLVIKCIKGSTADEYAKANNIKIEYFEDVMNCTYTGADEIIHYTGSPVELSNLKLFNSENEQLTQGVDYTVEYSNNVDIGTAVVTVTGRGEYLGKKEIEFDILCPYHDLESGYYTETAIYSDCETAGKIIKNCTFCGYYDDSQAAPVKEHGECKWQEVRASTCAQEGLEAYICADCGKHIEEKALEKLPHESYEWVVTTPATCLAEGVESQVCTACGTAVATRVIEKTSHEYTDWVVTTPATCTEPGTEKKLCKNCGEVEDEREIPAKGHSWSETPVVIKEATCTEDGEEATICANCGQIKDKKIIPASGHNWSEDWVVVKEVTCTEDGVEKILCKNCGEAQSERAIEHKGHLEPENWTVIKEATCTEDGSKIKNCTSCGEKIAEEVIKSSGHKETGEWVVVKKATCTEAGVEKMYCSICEKATRERAIKAEGHSESDWIIIVEPTCELKGLKHKVCSKCNTATKTEEIAALGHKTVWVTTVLPTYRHTGLKKAMCSVCGKDLNKTQIIAKVFPDLDGNKKISSSDALLVLQFSTGIKTPTDTQKQNADVNGDGRVNSTDALLILQLATGVITA